MPSELLDQAHRRVTEMIIKGLEHLSKKERSGKLSLLGLEKRRLRGDRIAAFQS